MNKRLKKNIFFYSITLGLGINMALTSYVKADTVSTDQNSHIQIINNKETESSTSATKDSQNVEKTQPESVNNEKKNQNSTLLLDNHGTEKQSQGNNTSSSVDKDSENVNSTTTFDVKNAISSKTAYATVRSLSASAYWSQEGWRKNSDGNWVYVLSNGQVARKDYSDSWQRLPDSTGTHWFYLNSDGVPYTNAWITDNNDDTYYMNNMGHITYTRGWRRNDNGDWVFIHSDGKVAKKHYTDSWDRLPDSTGWHWFYLNSYGVPYMNTWITDNNDDTYYMDNMGHITYKSGWRRDDNGNWVFIHSDGKVAKKHYTDSWDRLPDSTGWHWFYLNSYGVPYMNTWITDNNDDTYYMDNMGHITYKSGWRRNDNGNWVFIHSDGKVAKKHYSDSWQLLPDSTGWHWFYVNSYGVPYTNTWITDDEERSYYLDSMGHIA